MILLKETFTGSLKKLFIAKFSNSSKAFLRNSFNLLILGIYNPSSNSTFISLNSNSVLPVLESWLIILSLLIGALTAISGIISDSISNWKLLYTLLGMLSIASTWRDIGFPFFINILADKGIFLYSLSKVEIAFAENSLLVIL